MNILFLSAVLPYPLYSGGQVRIYNLLKLLSKNHSIYLASFIRDKQEIQYIKHLHFCSDVKVVMRGRVWQISYISRSLFGQYPLLYTSYDNYEMKKTISEILRKNAIDLVHIEPSYVWPSVPPIAVPLVVSEHNVEYQVYEQYTDHFPIVPVRPFLRTDVLKQKYWEKVVWNKADSITAVSESDATKIKSNNVKTPISVVPNGVDIEEFSYKSKKIISTSPLCLFVGNFSWMQNQNALIYLVKHIWPAIKSTVPQARLRIVGRKIPKNMKHTLSQILAETAENVSDIQSEYANADILLAPIRIGGGTKFKILEAMASGLPVVTTLKGIEGLSVKHDVHVLVTESPQDFATAVDKLIKNNKLVERLRYNARSLIVREFSWKIIAKKLDFVWKSSYEKKH